MIGSTGPDGQPLVSARGELTAGALAGQLRRVLRARPEVAERLIPPVPAPRPSSRGPVPERCWTGSSARPARCRWATLSGCCYRALLRAESVQACDAITPGNLGKCGVQNLSRPCQDARFMVQVGRAGACGQAKQRAGTTACRRTRPVATERDTDSRGGMRVSDKIPGRRTGGCKRGCGCYSRRYGASRLPAGLPLGNY